MEFKGKEMYITYDDLFGGCSRWRLFWDIVIRRKRGLRITWSFSPPETISEVDVDYISVGKSDGD